MQNTADLFEAARVEIASSVASAMAEEQGTASQTENTEEPVIDLEMALTQELSRATKDDTDGQGESSGEDEAAAASQEEVQEDSQEIVMPCYSADELIRKAILAGDEPDIIEDKDLGLTLLDYSSIL